MTTLYELLGALPHDDAEALRAAFRKAAKTTHPDTNPDPDASHKFRQIVRAHDILSDADQREAYDQLLTLALQEAGSKSRRTVYETIHKVASNTIAATIISGVLVGIYALFVPMSEAPAVSEKTVGLVARQPIEVAAPAPPAPSDAIARFEPRQAREDAPARDAAMAPRTAWPADGAGPISNIDLVPDLSGDDAKSYRTRGIFEYRNGDLNRALADFDQAIERDPNYADAYVDRGIVLFRMSQFDRAFADMTKAKRIASANRTKTTTATPVPPVPVPAPGPRKFSPVRVRNALNIAASDRYLDPGIQTQPFVEIQSLVSERRR